jgi:hypothetical protein
MAELVCVDHSCNRRSLHSFVLPQWVLRGESVLRDESLIEQSEKERWHST